MTDAAEANDARARRTLDTLATQVDTFEARVADRHALRCGPGCSACCEVSLSVGPLEAARVREALQALPEVRRQSLAARAMSESVRAGTRCVFLDAEGRCDVYAARPLVCRSQGLPLAYPLDVIPEEARAAELEGPAGPRAVVWCPLNFRETPPDAEDVLEAERVDVALAHLTRAFADARAEDPLARVELRALALAAPAPMTGIDDDTAPSER